MGKKNIIWNDYISREERFADFLNGVVFDGEQVIQPENLVTLDSKLWRRLPESENYQEYIRDNVKIWDCDGMKCIFSLEPEETSQSALPVKYMNYESVQYDKQYKKIKKKHRQNKDLSADEYISGFTSEDRLVPVVTIGVYLGGERWSGNTRLSKITTLGNAPLRVRKKIDLFSNEFCVNLFDIHRLKESNMFHTDLREVFGFLIRQRDKEELRAYVEHNNRFRCLREDAYNVLSIYSGSRELDMKVESYKTEEGIDMCRAIQEMVEDGRKEGLQRGMQKGYQDAIGAMSELAARLAENGRQDELYRALQDKEFQENLLKEYGIR